MITCDVPTMEFIKTLISYDVFLYEELDSTHFLVQAIFPSAGKNYDTVTYINREVEEWMDKGVYIEERDGEEAQAKLKKQHWSKRYQKD